MPAQEITALWGGIEHLPSKSAAVRNLQVCSVLSRNPPSLGICTKWIIIKGDWYFSSV